jgi:hypothetical protein
LTPFSYHRIRTGQITIALYRTTDGGGGVTMRRLLHSGIILAAALFGAAHAPAVVRADPLHDGARLAIPQAQAPPPAQPFLSAWEAMLELRYSR